jgi:hypothetical protein
MHFKPNEMPKIQNRQNLRILRIPQLAISFIKLRIKTRSSQVNKL